MSQVLEGPIEPLYILCTSVSQRKHLFNTLLRVFYNRINSKCHLRWSCMINIPAPGTIRQKDRNSKASLTPDPNILDCPPAVCQHTSAGPLGFHQAFGLYPLADSWISCINQYSIQASSDSDLSFGFLFSSWFTGEPSDIKLCMDAHIFRLHWPSKVA